MFFLQVKVKTRHLAALLLLFNFGINISNASDVEYYATDGVDASLFDLRKSDIVTLKHERVRRDVAPQPPTATSVTNTNVSSVPPDTNTTTTPPAPTTAATVTRVPLLGENGTGILKVTTTPISPKVSDPLFPDDYLPDVFKETPERIKAEQNLTALTIDNHNFYNSSFIGNVTFFNEHWANITKHKPEVHEVLSNSHRRATTLKLSFPFPFYGHPLSSITVATGGFLYTGEHVHNWLAATQYIAPLMANFDTTLTNDSLVKFYDDGERFTAFWENVTLREDKTKKFTFAVTLYKNGDIWFAYKDVPIPVQDINDVDHPVKVGISDAYITHRVLYYVRHKTIYEYHRVNYNNHEIVGNTILKLVALPTCLQYDSCESCVNHDTGFNCTWCEQIQRCSSGTDRNKQDWIVRNCSMNQVSDENMCRAKPKNGTEGVNGRDSYSTGNQPLPDQNIDIHTGDSNVHKSPINSATRAYPQTTNGIGGVVAACVIVALVASFAAWIVYAFKNPHTRSGQMLIKYRPSQWSWRRGEARYTAATIHM